MYEKALLRRKMYLKRYTKKNKVKKSKKFLKIEKQL